jgi:hypothetical protein
MGVGSVFPFFRVSAIISFWAAVDYAKRIVPQVAYGEPAPSVSTRPSPLSQNNAAARRGGRHVKHGYEGRYAFAAVGAAAARRALRSVSI